MKHRVFTVSVFVVYMAVMTAIMIWQGIGIAPDRYAFLLVLPAFLIHRMRTFLFDWIPFLFILISYDFLRGFADNLGTRVSFVEPIIIEKAIFGGLPTITLQRYLYNGNLNWWDFLFVITYFLHFAIPLTFGFVFWIYNRQWFKQFVTGILLLSFSGWVTYLIYPAAPPWMASQEGYIQPITKILNEGLKAFPERLSLPTIYHQMNPNPVAAIPSMHAAYPLLILIYAIKFFGKRAWFFSIYVAIVWFSIVYLGEHYVVDVIAGAIYAIIFYFVAMKMLHQRTWYRKVKGFFVKNNN